MLWKGRGLKQVGYVAANLKTSDHRPVSSLFDCTINIVDEDEKEKLNRILFERHRHSYGVSISKDDLSENEDDYIRTLQGIPSASSDYYKWWLDNGMMKYLTVSFVPSVNDCLRLPSSIEYCTSR